MLGQQLLSGANVPERAHGRCTADGHRVRAPPLAYEALSGGLDGGLEVLVLQVTGPHHLGPEELVEDDVPARDRRWITAENQCAREAEAVGRGRRHAYVIALTPTAGDQRVASESQRLGAQIFQLARLVAATRETGEVVALHPE